MPASHDDDALAHGDPLAAFLPALRAEVPAREAAVDAVKARVRGDVASITPAATPAVREPSTAPRRPAGVGTLARWLATPRPLRLSPLAAAALLVVVAGTGTLVGRSAGRVSPEAAVATAPVRTVEATPVDGSPRVVRFTLRAPEARRVALVGDFNGWDATAAPLERRGDEWTIVIPVAPGRHVYGFVVDDAQWIPDPAAPRAETEFGAPNSVLVVGT